MRDNPVQRRGTIWLLSVGVCLLVAVATTRIGSNKSTKYVHVVTGNQRRQQLLSTESEVDRALGESDGYTDSRQKLGRVQATGVSEHSLDEGLPTLTSKTIWANGSPQNQGWSGGDFEAGTANNAGTGKIKGTQYAWWQRHLMPDKDFQETVAHLKAAEPHYDAHGNEYDPSEREGENAPMSYRGPGFNRMSP